MFFLDRTLSFFFHKIDHGAEVSIKFSSNARGSQHAPPPDHPCGGDRDLQQTVCSEPMAQHSGYVYLREPLTNGFLEAALQVG